VIRALAAAILLAGCAGGPTLTESGIEGCDLEVTFGSYAMGVDQALKVEIQNRIDGEAAVSSIEERWWGREGESTICIRTFDAAGADRLYTAVAAMIPEHSDRAPTTVSHLDGRSHGSTWPERP
jgi:hypothetical protein